MLVDTYRSKIGRGYDVHLPATHIPNEVRCRASMASDEPQICTSACLVARKEIGATRREARSGERLAAPFVL